MAGGKGPRRRSRWFLTQPAAPAGGEACRLWRFTGVGVSGVDVADLDRPRVGYRERRRQTGPIKPP